MQKFNDSDESKEVFIRGVLRKSYARGQDSGVVVEIDALGILHTDCTGNVIALAVEEEKVHRCKKTVSYQLTD